MSSHSGLDSSEEGEISASGYDTPIPPAQMRPSYHNAQWRDCLYTADGRPVSGSFMFREASIASYTSPNYYEPRSSGGSVDIAPTRPNRSGSNHRAAGAHSAGPAAELCSLGPHPCMPHGILDQLSWTLVEVDYTALLAALILLIVYG